MQDLNFDGKGQSRLKLGLYFVLISDEGKDSIIFHPDLQKVIKTLNGEDVSFELNYSCSKILEFLVINAGLIVTREDMLEYAWPGRIVSPSSLNQSISMLREIVAFGEETSSIIKTIPRHGYKINSSSVNAVSLSDPRENLHPEISSDGEHLKPTEIIVDKVTNKSSRKSFQIYFMALNSLPHRSKYFICFLCLFTAFNILSKLDWSYIFYPPKVLVFDEEYLGKIAYVADDDDSALSMKHELTPAIERMLRASSSNDAKIIFSQMFQYYDIACIHLKGKASFITVHKEKISSLTDLQFRECLNG